MIGVVVVLYNPSPSEVENINTYREFAEHIVIEDNSSCSNFEMVKDKVGTSEKIDYYSHVENIGLCKALNEGLSRLQEVGCDWGCVFDADSKMQTNIFQIYRDILNSYSDLQSVSVFAPQHNHARNRVVVYDGVKEIKWAMTSGWLINLSIFFKLGGFFDDLFVDGLDMDYCYRARERGYKILECGNAIIEHYPAETREIHILGLKFKYGYSSPQRYMYQSRCLIWLYRRYGYFSDFIMYLYKWFKVMFLFDDKKKFVKSMVQGTKEGNRLFKEYKEGRSNEI